MMRFSEKMVFSLAIFLFAVVLLYQTLGMRDDVALVPRIFGSLLLMFSGIQVLIDVFPAVARRLAFLNRKLVAEPTSTATAPGIEEQNAEAWLGKYVFFGWMAVFVLLIYFTSMFWATVISLFVYLKWISNETWTLTASYCAGAALFIYLVFVVGFKLHYFL